MATQPTIIVCKRGISYRLCKVWFGTDGSFYVTVPYHPARKALFTKATVDYTAAGAQILAANDALEIALLDDDDARRSCPTIPMGSVSSQVRVFCPARMRPAKSRALEYSPPRYWNSGRAHASP